MINTAANTIEKAPFMLDPNNRSTTSTIRRSARKLQAKYGKVGAIFVDYIQRVIPLNKTTLAVQIKN